MQRRGFLKAGLATWGAGLVNVGASETPKSGASASPAQSAALGRSECNSIQGYLNREAERITQHALARYPNAAAWRRNLPQRRQRFMEMMGLDGLPPRDQGPPLNVKVTGVVERPKYRIEKLYYESVPKLYVTANLYIPNSLSAKAPAVLYVCGHSDKQKTHYGPHARRFAELGFVCLLVETIEGEENHGTHHGQYQKGFFHWHSRGYTSAGIEMLNGMRGVDLLVARPEVDAKRIGVTGVSGGGSYSWWVPAGDERVKISAPVCGTSTLASHLHDHTLDSNCDCMWWLNTCQWDLVDVAALIAPRPMLIGDSDHDVHFALRGITEVHRQVKQLYTVLGVPENVSFVVAPGAHSYHPLSRTTVFSWFLKHLQGKNVPPSEVGDVDERPEDQESEATLRVYVNGPPEGNRVKTIQDNFINLAPPPQIASADDVAKARSAALAGLRQKTFAAFPSTPPPLDLHVDYEFEVRTTKGTAFHFTSEEGWRLRGVLHVEESITKPAPVVVGLRSPLDKFNLNDWNGGPMEEFLRPLHHSWAKAAIDLRGTGDTGYSQALQWQLRRAAPWTGRTLASMWVYDTLRALACVRQLPQVDGRQVALAARGQMAAVALYAALLDGHVTTLFLESPPPTQDAPSNPDGEGDAIEMIACLRFTDLPQVAGLLHPAELVFIGDCPSTYDWAQEVYQRLESANRFRRISKLADWQPI
jgi:cephalosporin-C deacetylase-like acetyl esterase